MTPNIAIARAWDACVITDFLAGAPRAATHARAIVAAAQRGECQIWTSVFSQVEVAYLNVLDKAGGEEIIEEFFRQDYIVSMNLDESSAGRPAKLIRRFGIKGKDAVHVASAIHWRVPVFETFDAELLRKFKDSKGDATVGGLVVRAPL